MIPTSEVFELIAALMLFVAIWAQVGSFVLSKIQVIIIQTTLLSIYTVLLGIYESSIALIVLAILIIFLRGVVTAYILLRKFPERSQLVRESSTTVPSIIILSIGVIIVSLVVYQIALFPVIQSLPDSVQRIANPPIIALGFVIAIQGFLLIATRKNKVTQFTGYIEIENAMVLLSLGIFPLPLVIEISVLLDVLALVIVGSVLLSGSLNSERLEDLTG